MDLQQDADDEAIMDIAIALSLQEHDLQTLEQDLENLEGLHNRAMQNLGAVPNTNQNTAAGGPSDVSVSGAGSDDEGSTAATIGSTLRTSPAEQASGSGGSESGGSVVESIGGTSGRSSTYGDQLNQSPPRSADNIQRPMSTTEEAVVVEESSTAGEPEEISDNENAILLHNLRFDFLIEIFRIIM